MDMQPDITAFESQFNGPFPFRSDGIVIGTPDAGFEEEMESMIVFAGSEIDTDTLYHENMHQWWGDKVSEGGYRMTFFKEGLATLGEFLYQARLAEDAAGGPSSPRARPPSRPAWSSSSTRHTVAAADSGRARRRTRRRTPCSTALCPTQPEARGRLHRAAPDPRPRQVHRGAAGAPAQLRRGQHQRGAAGSRLPPVAARA